MRLLAGAYINDVETNHVGDFQYASANPTFAENIGAPGFQLGNATLPTPGVNTVGPRSPATVFFNDFTRTEDETALFGEIAFDLSDTVSLALSARYYDLTSQLQGASNFSFGCRYGIGGNSQETADGRCNGTDFSNDVSERLRILGEYNQSGDDNLILNAMSPNGDDGSPRDLFRGGIPSSPGSQCSTGYIRSNGFGSCNQNALNAIKEGNLNISDLQSDGSINETDTIVKASLEWAAAQDVMLFANFSQGYRPATQNRNAGQLAANQSGAL